MLEGGTQLAGSRRALGMTWAVRHALRKRALRPSDAETLMGTLQWYDLLRRTKLAIYQDVYQWIRQGDHTSPASVGQTVLDELTLGIILGIYWRCDLTRPFIPRISASDASTVFGFGVSTAPFPVELLHAVARWSEKQGTYAVLDGDPTGVTRVDRAGESLHLDLRLSNFKDVLSIRCRYPDHINILEGQALVLWLKWLLRTRFHHRARAAVLIDSAVVLGAAAKGRSSTRLNRVLRKLGALEMIGDVLVYLILVPSVENPSDPPSGGKRKRARKIDALAAPPVSPRGWGPWMEAYTELKNFGGDLIPDLPVPSRQPYVPCGTKDGL